MIRATTFALATTALCLAAPTARAQDLAMSLHPIQVSTSRQAPLPDVPLPSPRRADTASADKPSGPVSDALLADLRGGQTLIVGSQTMIAITTGNVLNGDYSAGDVSLTDNALSNFNGVGNLLINTGAQVSLQSGMNLIINTVP